MPDRTRQTGEPTADDWIERLMRDYQDDLTRGLYRGVYRLAEPDFDAVMRCQARACVEAFVRLYDLPPDLDLAAFLERMATAGPSRVNIRHQDGAIIWEELHAGQCMCPLVRRDVVPLAPALCVCGVHWLRMLIERHAHRRARVELLESVARGGQNCVFRISFPDDAHLGRGPATTLGTEGTDPAATGARRHATRATSTRVSRSF